MVTDAGFARLKGMTNLRCLSLNGTRITDAGLEHLKGMTALFSLRLGRTDVTDAGLDHLKDIDRTENPGSSPAQRSPPRESWNWKCFRT